MSFKEISPLCVPIPFDARPYLKVSIGGVSCSCLLDSGASNTVIGKAGVNFLKDNNIPYSVLDTSLNVCTADGTSQYVEGEVILPFCFNGLYRDLRCFLVPSVQHNFVLGVDFGRAFGVVLDLKNNSWELAETSIVPKICDKSLLNKDQLRILQETIDKFRTLDSPELGRTDVTQHYIDTGNARPFRQRQYMLSPAIQAELHKEIDAMLKLGVIKPSKSPWCSPVLMVRKKNGEYRFCFDGRQLNKVTVKDAFALPFIDSILSRLRDARYLSSIDLKKAFWQIPLETSSREKTAFSVQGRGLFEFVVMPFGLVNSPQTFQRAIEQVLGSDLLNGRVFCYLDDLCIATSTFEEHIEVLDIVYNKLRVAGFTINFEKCEFCKSSLKFLGFVVDEGGLRSDPEKVQAILALKAPKTTTEIKRAMGLISYYRRFLPNFSTLSAPINSLLKGRKRVSLLRGLVRPKLPFSRLNH